MLQPTLPKIPPLIVAAKAIPNSLSARELFDMLHYILHGLLNVGINVVSYACDGTETERAVQNLLVLSADTHFPYTIPHPDLSLPPLAFHIPVFHGHPVAIIQDAKHAAKTYRNNAYSGARAMVSGNHAVLYAHVRELAFEPDSPLYHRDVEKVDRQDDNAATRMFSSSHLQHMIIKRPENTGTIVYLFVNGEVIDMIVSPKPSHLQRFKMGMRAKFYYFLWERYLDKANYPAQRYIISREALDITRILIDGYISLLLIHRDHMPNGQVYPFIPWLHSTESCEHLFAECRRLVKDFTHLDFLYMIPRLMVRIRSACRLGTTTDPRARANGYAHTYFDSGDVDLALLSHFPTNDELQVATQEAWEEATNLWDLLGVTPFDLLAPAAVPMLSLPSITSWFTPGDDPVYDHFDSDSDESDGSDLGRGVDVPSLSDQLQQLIDRDDDPNAPPRTNATDEQMLSLKCAAVALTLGDMTDL